MPHTACRRAPARVGAPVRPRTKSFLSWPNDLIFGEDDKSSGLSYKDREERVRQLREKQQLEKQQKLEELKEQAAAAQKFREQQENERRRRLEDMRLRDADRRSQVEERKRIIQQAEQDRREAVLRKTAEREQRLESKRRNEKSNIVFAFGSSTPRMLDPKDSASTFWGSRR
nr:MAP7 domain-containing protein 2-like [Penaeus vannamei]